MSNTERNYGVDILRIVAGFMIVFLHCFTMGGIVFYSTPGSSQEIVSLICSVLTIAGVNIFAVISGYVACCSKEQKTKYSKYIEIWLTVVFYSLIISIIASFMYSDYSFSANLLETLAPASSNLYWYFSAFTGLYIVKPFIDTGLRKSSVGLLKKVCIAILIGFSCIVAFSDILSLSIDPFSLYRGYSPIWIIFMYIIGYSVNKCDILKKNKNSSLLLMLFVTFLIAFVAAIIIKRTYVEDSVGIVSSCLVYTFPTTVVTAVLMLVIFSRIKVKEKYAKAVKVVAPTVFSVYILNCHPLMLSELITDRFMFLCEENPFIIVSTVVGFSLAFTVVAIIIDLLRIQLFKLLHIKNLAVLLENTARKGINKLADLI